MAAASLRLDKWLWHARFFKTRGLAARLCAEGRVRLNRAVVRKAHQPVRPGDVLTFPQGAGIRVVEVLALGERRGPAPEAQGLYRDLDRPVEARPAIGNERAPVAAETTGPAPPKRP